MTTGERINARRKETGVPVEKIAEALGVSIATVYRYENGEIEKLPGNTLEPLARILDTTPAALMGWTENQEPKISNIFQIETKKFPLLGEVSCGQPIYASEDFESYVEAGADIVADFCLRCKGDSMINARILDGDIVFIRKQSTVNNGEIAVVVIEDEATLKRVFYYPDKSKLVLQAENPTYEPFIYVGEEIDHILILGKAVAFQSDVR